MESTTFDPIWEAEIDTLLSKLYEAPSVAMAVDTEGTGLTVAAPDGDYCIGVSVAGCFEDGTPFAEYIPTAHPNGGGVSEETRAKLEWVLLQEERVLVFANAPYDILSLGTMGFRLDETDFIDVIVQAHLIDENKPFNKGLDSLAKLYLDDEKVLDPFVESEKKSGNQNITPEQMREYAIKDAVLTWRLWDLFEVHPVWTALPKAIWPAKQELARLLIEMKRRGITIDTELCFEMIQQGEAELKRLAKELGYPAIPKKPTKMYPDPDPDPLPTLGPIALHEIFIERLELPVLKRGKPKKGWPLGAPSFDKEVMAEYDMMLELLDSPEAKLVKQYRGWQKAVSAAYRPYVELLDLDGRLRCSYKMHGTKTGRLSCEKPNLQQVPKVSDKVWNGKVKECFIARPGYTLLNADFSQLELRLATVYAGEPELIKVFAEGRDIFDEMALALGMSRQDTKMLVYSMQYGAGLNRLMTAFGVSKTRAEEIRTNYFNTYPLFKRLADRCAALAEATNQINLWNGRYRHFEFKSDSFKAMNSLIQGGAADIVEAVMVRCFRELDNEDCRMLLQVHDSITFEVKNELVEEYMPRIKAMMEDVGGAVGSSDFDRVKFAVEVEFWTDREETLYTDWKLAA